MPFTVSDSKSQCCRLLTHPIIVLYNGTIASDKRQEGNLYVIYVIYHDVQYLIDTLQNTFCGTPCIFYNRTLSRGNLYIEDMLSIIWCTISNWSTVKYFFVGHPVHSTINFNWQEKGNLYVVDMLSFIWCTII